MSKNLHVLEEITILANKIKLLQFVMDKLWYFCGHLRKRKIFLFNVLLLNYRHVLNLHFNSTLFFFIVTLKEGNLHLFTTLEDIEKQTL